MGEQFGGVSPSEGIAFGVLDEEHRGSHRMVSVTHVALADRNDLVRVFCSMAEEMERDSDALVTLLSRYEPIATAINEVEKTVRCLREYSSELPYLEGRSPYGDVAVSLPFNNPLYSLVLYTGGVALGGSRVLVRPSRLTEAATQQIVSSYATMFDALNINLQLGSSQAFIGAAREQASISTLIFTGNFESLTSVRARFPSSKGLIYCGSGLNPFVVGPEPTVSLERIAELIIESRFYNSGQDCLCTERLYIHDSIADQLVPIVVAKASELQKGDFGDPEAHICPLVPPIAAHAQTIVRDLHQSARCHLAGEIVGALVPPHVFETRLEDPNLISEKYSPILTFARYRTSQDLHAAAKSPYLFGATVIDATAAAIFKDYPHLTVNETVIDVESDDAHIPFGGRQMSGFVERRGQYHDGPILYSVETTHHS